MKKFAVSCLFAISVLALFGCASTTNPGAVGISRPQLLLVPAAAVEKAALANYASQAVKAKESGHLITSGSEYARLLTIAKRVKAQVPVFRQDTAHWKWSLVLIDSPTINASCAPGGKITFYTGIIRHLDLTDDEIAAVMGHEIAHALREHGRERMSQALAANVLTQAAVAGTKNPSTNAVFANEVTKYLFLLPNSRENELEADKIGLELAARAGYNPYGAVTLWRKMAAVDKSRTPEFVSTHPSNQRREQDLSMLMPTVMPLYKASIKH
jgi:predicted Zn-dependent protease